MGYDKLDFWSQKARREGYPARSVYKLKELNEKFNLLPRAPRAEYRVLDLGAAPGSWSLFVLRTLGANIKLTACDLAPLSRESAGGAFDDAARCFIIQGDFTSDEIYAAIKEHGLYDLVLCDAAPATSGNRALDTQRSLDLADCALRYAETLLKPAGNCAIKVFQGGESAALLARGKTLFRAARNFKPAACRSSSFEVYFTGLGRTR